MSTIYIDEQGAVLHHRGDEIQVEKEHVILAKLPLTQIDRIVLAGAVQLTTQTIDLLLKHGIPVSFMTIPENIIGLGRVAVEPECVVI